MAKGIMYINGQRVAFDGEKNVLAVIRKAGINMPTLCYYSDLSVYGACRMCVVEDDRGRIDASCSMEPRDGLSIQTNTARLGQVCGVSAPRASPPHLLLQVPDGDVRRRAARSL